MKEALSFHLQQKEAVKGAKDAKCDKMRGVGYKSFSLLEVSKGSAHYVRIYGILFVRY